MSVTQVVSRPFPGVQSALVIAGADKRGTIFGVYDLSEQMGVSPWRWWADVPVPQNTNVYVKTGRYVQPEPRVKYRGIFLNDEAPSLSGWTQEKFGGYNHQFYEHVFDLLLRLKANFLWPAMWNNAFNEDDPVDPALADEYGIVMGTSHHEPMMRAQQEWKRHGTGPWDYTLNQQELNDFWRLGVRRNRNFEELTTVGMRGDGDMAMSADTNTALLERIVANQRSILSEEVNPDVTKVPQVWALYKEVQGYYEKGMRVPDDVTLLWCDDNWGNIRRLPTAEERARPGGAGIYYHFDYVGDPRSYKWLLTYNITKVWEQMHLAAEYGADRMWIVNVGDLKPMEFPIEFFLNMARTPNRWGKDDLQAYTEEWATREFGPEHAGEIADVLNTYTKYNSRRKPEQLEPDTYSLTQDHEADRVWQQWIDLAARAERLGSTLPENKRAAFFELVLYPVKASATVGEMYVAAGRNRLYAKQGRRSANLWADKTRRLFAQDAELTDEYNHRLLHGKWNHMMDQTHIGYTFWNEPPANAMPAVQEVQTPRGTGLAVFGEGSEQLATELPPFDSVNRQTRTLELTSMGSEPVAYTVRSSAPWIQLSSTAGKIRADTTLKITIDWGSAPVNDSAGSVTIEAEGQQPIVVHLRIQRPSFPSAGFVENAGVVAIEAEHFTSNRPAGGVTWQVIPGFGETLSGMEAFPVLAPSTLPGAPQACLDYTFSLHESGARKFEAVTAPTSPFVPKRGLRYSIAVDRAAPLVVDVWGDTSDAEWRKAVSDGVHKVTTSLGTISIGVHTLHVCRVDAGIVFERFQIYSGSAPMEYLGRSESAQASAPLHAH